MAEAPHEVPTLLNDSTPFQICASPLNLSKAKHLFSFSKSERFPKRDVESTCKVAFYDIPSRLYRSNREAGLGKGNKYDFTKTAGNFPAPNSYAISRNLQTGTSTFGLGREKVALNGIIPKKINANDNPGPGTYPIADQKSNIAFSMKTRPPLAVPTHMSAPAPGKYDINPTITLKGVYAPSKYLNSKAPIISSSSQSRFKNFSTSHLNPAPGKYPVVDAINTSGVYKLTKFKNSMCRSFSQADRMTLGVDITKKSNFPGPGNYRLPSEFGYYKSSANHSLPKLAATAES